MPSISPCTLRAQLSPTPASRRAERWQQKGLFSTYCSAYSGEETSNGANLSLLTVVAQTLTQGELSTGLKLLPSLPDPRG